MTPSGRGGGQGRADRAQGGGGNGREKIRKGEGPGDAMGRAVILVTGATGNLGGLVARKLLGRGEAVRVLARDPRKAAPLAEAGAEVARGDFADPRSLDAALAGAGGSSSSPRTDPTRPASGCTGARSRRPPAPGWGGSSTSPPSGLISAGCPSRPTRARSSTLSVRASRTRS